MNYERAYYPESRFGGFTDFDGTMAFYLRINSLVDPSSVVLDIGCGKGAYAEDAVLLRRGLRIFRGKVNKVVGVDTAKTAQENPFVDEFHLTVDSSNWPLSDESVDLCLCDQVLEHIENPELFFSECRRVTKRGGYLCIRTTNVQSYVGLASRLVPDKSHALVLGKVQDNRKEGVFFLPCIDATA